MSPGFPDYTQEGGGIAHRSSFGSELDMSASGAGSRKGSHLVFAGLVAAYFISFFFRVSASVVLPQLSSEWGMDAALTSFISSLYFYAYAAMQPISGALNDRFGSARVVSVGLLVGSCGAFLFGSANGPLVLSAGRLLTGLGLAPMLSGALVYQGANFDQRKYAIYSGITFFMGNLGAVASVSPLGIALDRWGRPTTFAFLGILAIVLSVMLFTAGRRGVRPKADPGEPVAKGIAAKLAGAWKSIRSSRALGAAALLWCVSLGPLLALQGLWAVAWSAAVYPGDMGAARLWATMVGVGVMAGNAAAAFLKMKPGARRKYITAGIALHALCWTLLVVGMGMGAPFALTATIATLIGATTGLCHPLLSSVFNEKAPKGEGGAVFGLANMGGFILIIASQSGTGLVIKAMSGKGGYAPAAFSVAFGMLTLIVLAALPLTRRLE